MTYIKKLVISGFKSFAKRTEIDFDNGMNVIVGPNGSGKTNVSDALCFALGRLSIKSIRAAKAKNLLFMGNKQVKPVKEAFVEITFDNKNKTFNIPENEIKIKRIVRSNGQSIYKLNSQTKTRGEIIEALAQGGIDPYGFNLILQGQIQSIVKMHSDERRKIIEEAAGIAIYEARKEKSLRELDKAESRLKEVSTILRERKAFLNNLEKERQQALKFKELESMIKKCKASILSKKLEDKDRELDSIRKTIELNLDKKRKLKENSELLQQEMQDKTDRINQINKHIYESSGFEQESLHEQIANLKAELEGLRVRKENYENKEAEIQNRIDQMKNSLPEYEKEIEDLRKKSPLIAKKQTDLAKKKNELKVLEEERKKIYSLKSELNALKERIRDKELLIAKLTAESDNVLKQIEELSSNLQFDNLSDCKKNLEKMKETLHNNRQEITNLNKNEIEITKLISSAESEIKSAEIIKAQISGIDICPVCQNKMTEKHISHVHNHSNSRIKSALEQINQAKNNLAEVNTAREKMQKDVKIRENSIFKLEGELQVQRSIIDKKTRIKNLLEEEKSIKHEIEILQRKRESMDNKKADSSDIEIRYSEIIREIEEISSRTEENLDNTLQFKERDLEKMKEVIRLSEKDLQEINTDIEEINQRLEGKSYDLGKKEKENEKLAEKFNNFIAERDLIQKNLQKNNLDFSEKHSEIRQIEDQINYLKIGNAKISAEKEAIEMELKDFHGIELIKASLIALEEKLKKSQEIFTRIGNVNLRALEVYEEIKQEYDKVQEKVNILDKEKLEILKIVEEIDKKKKRAFMKTFSGINELFTSNFSKLYTKGKAFLELENKEDIFQGGVNIAIKLAKGKYFDVTSLSGGEQSLIAIALLFAIQEYKPYHFYIFDEIDAALDKRNSQRLSDLLKKYMQGAQYIVVTHNDALITDSNVLYGVSMHDGISKILSLKLN